MLAPPELHRGEEPSSDDIELAVDLLEALSVPK
jgi:hypothetical protein